MDEFVKLKYMKYVMIIYFKLKYLTQNQIRNEHVMYYKNKDELISTVQFFFL